jgi:hypothetical protein
VPKPRDGKPSEKEYRRVSHNNSVSKALPLPSWYNSWLAVKKHWKKAREGGEGMAMQPCWLRPLESP